MVTHAAASNVPTPQVTSRVLVVDDEVNARTALAELLADEGYATETAADGEEALKRLATFDPHVVLTDLKMPVMDGLELVTRGKPQYPHTAFVVMTAFGSIATAVEAIKAGAEHYLTKPLDLDAVTALVSRAAEKAQLSREAAALRKKIDERFRPGSILGRHPSMQELVRVIEHVGPSKATVLIHGESGTGKELIASAIHQASPRREGPFVRLNCAALAESLLESELFGHEKGAFTGALARREGRFKQADGGTLFLDEVSEIPPAVQVKLLRFLQEKEFERVGGNETLSVDVRIVAATNRDLSERVKTGAFRADLYYRLNVVKLEVPPLRARKADIPLLAQHFLRRFAAESGREDIEGFSDEALEALVNYPWPGNVRELENAIERAVVLCTSKEIRPEDLSAASSTTVRDPGLLIPGLTLAELERVAILQALEAEGGSTARAAARLGISRRKIQYRLREWKMNGAETREPDALEGRAPERTTP